MAERHVPIALLVEDDTNRRERIEKRCELVLHDDGRQQHGAPVEFSFSAARSPTMPIVRLLFGAPATTRSARNVAIVVPLRTAHDAGARDEGWARDQRIRGA